MENGKFTEEESRVWTKTVGVLFVPPCSQYTRDSIQANLTLAPIVLYLIGLMWQEEEDKAGGWESRNYAAITTRTDYFKYSALR